MASHSLYWIYSLLLFSSLYSMTTFCGLFSVWYWYHWCFFYLIGSPKVGGAGDGKHKKKYGHPYLFTLKSRFKRFRLNQNYPLCDPYENNNNTFAWIIQTRSSRSPATLYGPDIYQHSCQGSNLNSQNWSILWPWPAVMEGWRSKWCICCKSTFFTR